jgi:cytochrome P450
LQKIKVKNIKNNILDIQKKLQEEVDKLSDEPDVEEYENLKYLNQVMNETLRMFPPATSIQKNCTKNISINGYIIPNHTFVVISIVNIKI